jgi:hypothetical protein
MRCGTTNCATSRTSDERRKGTSMFDIRKTERQKNRKTERQRDRKTERQKDRKTERQKDRKTRVYCKT